MSQAKQTGTVLGAFEEVSFPLFGDHTVVAKIDTGAYSGALHCSFVEEKDQRIKFRPFDIDIEITCDEFLVKYVKSSNGKREKRYFIETDVVIAGKQYPVLLSLSDRSEMKWPVLIGRRFLKLNGFLIDPAKDNGYVKEDKL